MQIDRPFVLVCIWILKDLIYTVNEKLSKILNFNGFVLLPEIFESSSIKRAKNGLWEVIKGNYETGVEPENRFWNPGDNSKHIIKIDKPHLSNKALFDLITTKSFGQYIAKVTSSIKIQIWHTQAV